MNMSCMKHQELQPETFNCLKYNRTATLATCFKSNSK